MKSYHCKASSKDAMFKITYRLIGIALILPSLLFAEITVPNGFVVEKLLDQIDGHIPRLEAIRNPEYGFGVIVASMDREEGILILQRISKNSVEPLGSMSGFPVHMAPIEYGFPYVVDIGYGKINTSQNELYLTIINGYDQNSVYTEFVHVSSEGDVHVLWRQGGADDNLGFLFAISEDMAEYEPGVYLLDSYWGQGHSLWHMDQSSNLKRLQQDSLPPDRRDLDVMGLSFDPTGLYGGRLTLVDSDINSNDNDWSVIYQICADLSYIELAPKQTTSEVLYTDMCFSTGNAFGQTLYVTDRITESIMSVEPNGDHHEFAAGFYHIGSISVSSDGQHMYVSDANGIYLIQQGESGPQMVMREPKVESDGVHSNPKGVDDVRILWSEPVSFEKADVAIVDKNGYPIPFALSGSNSPFMVITFGRVLQDNMYSIIIHDSVRSVANEAAIDGDHDGFAGGDAVFTMEHRHCHSFDNNDDIGLSDFSEMGM